MANLKRLIKNIFVWTGTLFILDKINYRFSWIKNFSENRNFRKLHPDFALPPDYFLYETYTLSYTQYKLDGENAAIEILDWTKKYLQQPLKILEWGCGVARVTRHLPKHLDSTSEVYGADINKEMVSWDEANIRHVSFSRIEYMPPASFDEGSFNLVIALSVFTHIEKEFQAAWLQEIHRITAQNGIFLFTTHGKKYDASLGNKEKKELEQIGSLTVSYRQKGHRMMATYNRYEYFRATVENYFTILEYYDGEKFPDKIGGQDLWIVRKK